MNFKATLLSALMLVSAFAVNAAFKSGKFYYEVLDEAQAMVYIATPPENVDAYQNVTSTDFLTQVTHSGKTYKVVGIGPGAFASATIESGTNRIPEGYLFIDAMAFDKGGGDGSSIKLPASMQLIADNAFAGNQLHGLTVVTDNPYFAHLSIKNSDGSSIVVLTNKAKTQLVACVGGRAKTYNADGSTTYVSTIEIPEQITKIAGYAFYGNTHLTKVKLHSGITEIGDGAFHSSNLSSIDMSMLPATCKFGVSLFSDSHNLKSAKLPEGITEIPTQMFFCCDALSSINLPAGIKAIRKQALSTTALSSVDLPESLELLDTCALQSTAISSIDLKNVKTVLNQCFSGCENLSTVIGEKVETLGGSVFSRCPMTEAPFFPVLKTTLGTPWFRCTNLVELRLPNTLESLLRNPAVGCTALNEYKVDEGGKNYVELDSCIYEIKNGKPYRLVGVPAGRFNTELYLQPGTEYIGEQAIREVPLTAIYAPADLKEIYEGSGFSKDIMTVQVLATVPPVGGGAFAQETYENGTLYVPKGSVEAYKAADGWKNFLNIVGIDVAEPGVKGDVNGDGAVDVADLNMLINAVLGAATVDTSVGDLNGDTLVDIADVNALINIILGA